jgi:transcription antitermination factor NusG
MRAPMSWWVAQTESRREEVAARFLQLAGYETYLPKGREGRAIKVLFPSYLFVARAAQWYRARWSVGVVRLVAQGTGGEPTCIGEDVVGALRQRERGGVTVLPERPGLMPGDRVLVRRGPFVDRLALYEDQAPHERVAILLTWLGTQRRVELAAGDVTPA